MGSRKREQTRAASAASTKRSSRRTATVRDPPESLRTRWPAIWRDDRARFSTAFVVIAGGLLVAYYFPRGSDSTVEQWTAEYLRFYTHAVALPIALFEPHVSAHGNVISGRFSMQIVKSCDAMEANILFASAILAVSAPWVRKAIALVVGLTALVAFNFVRLFVLYWVGVFAFSTFEFLHYDLWPLLMIAFAAVDFVVAMHWARSAPTAQPVVQEAGAHVAG
ncbi:MAG: hypothetical protein ACLP1X_17895 [Polyangiaceae bacterium]